MRANSSRYRLIGHRDCLLAIVTLGLIVALFAFNPTLDGFALDPAVSEEELRKIVSNQLQPVYLLLAAKIGVSLVLVLALLRYASRIKRSGLFPPPGAWAFKDQRIFSDPYAFAISLLFYLVGVLGLLIVGIITYIAYHFEDIVVGLYLSVV